MPQFGWIGAYTVVVFDPTVWPAIEQLLRAVRASEPRKIDVGSIAEPEFTWVYKVTDDQLVVLLNAFHTFHGGRTPNNPAIDVRQIIEPIWNASYDTTSPIVNTTNNAPEYYIFFRRARRH